LQPLLDRDDIENIEIFGFDHVESEDTNGRLASEAPVARSDADLVDALAFLASRQDNERPFSEARPSLNLSLEGDARLAAVAFVTPRPVVVIRRHRLRQVTLDDLVGKGTLSPGLAGFLRAAVTAGLSPVVAGHQGAGKTTLARALAECIPVREKIGTFETERELFLDQLPGRDSGRVISFEARPGTGEFLPNGRMAGEVTLSELMFLAKRFNLDREIVGEVRGDEILAMIDAMLSGAGSLSTTHGRSARQAFSKLVTCAMAANPAFTQTTAARALAETIDLVVYLRREDVAGRRYRYVTEVIAPGWVMDGASGHVDFSDIYVAGDDGRAVPHTIADDMALLLAGHGFDAAAFQGEAATQLGKGLR
jgi:Flp pilus assembly CpaF family ATPase